MPMPVKSLPVVQNWDCHGCADCCKTYDVPVTEAERARIEAQNWAADAEFQAAHPGVAPVVADDRGGGHRLQHSADGTCVFLGPEHKCRIHAKFGGAAKPRACRIYPFALVPAGDHWRVGIRYACPSAADNRGRPLSAHAADVTEYAALLAGDAGVPTVPPPLAPGQVVSWPDLLRFVKAFDDFLAEPGITIEHRLRRVLALASQCKHARFDTINGARLTEFLTVMSAAVADEVPARPDDLPRPGWVGRSIFRQTAAVYARKDTGRFAGVARQGRLTRIRAAWQFAVGMGPIPRLHALIPETTFEAADRPTGPLSPEADALLTRYFRVKIESLQFCGAPNFGRSFWDGLESLALTFPVILWLGRVLTTDARPRDDAIRLALQIVDDSFGYNKLLGAGRQLWAVTALAERDELPKLVAWYAR
ncbi:YkgJ family cysteine cluster protein [Fimbriiglobus ruber]|uniref:YkgJ family cysteine cluster protein n=1 Tax=Fimbriiglobus ruber TaxID=1908690 RepID=A0A225D4Q8_9BACT|nr:YkgJ family cysteine cluster protein [Fimbriiglobus ruber]OWK34624.1 hypothetical protein FRUB_10595 [Fimbriiglobus ruber]